MKVVAGVLEDDFIGIGVVVICHQLWLIGEVASKSTLPGRLSCIPSVRLIGDSHRLGKNVFVLSRLPVHHSKFSNRLFPVFNLFLKGGGKEVMVRSKCFIDIKKNMQ